MQRCHNAKAVLIVGAHATHIGHATAHDLHTNSPAAAGHTRPACSASNPVPTLTDALPTRTPMNPTNYSLFGHIRHRYREFGRLTGHHVITVFRLQSHDAFAAVGICLPLLVLLVRVLGDTFIDVGPASATGFCRTHSVTAKARRFRGDGYSGGL